MATSSRKKPWWKENLSLKIISLILAISLEIYFYSPDNSLSVSLPVTVEVRNVPSSLMFIDPRNGERGIPARVEVRGPRPVIEQVRTSNHRYVIDYPQDQPTVFTTPIDPKKLWLPAGVEILEIQPSTLTVVLEKTASKSLPLELEFQGELRAGFQKDKIAYAPESIGVTGPESEVLPLKQLRAQKINLEGLQESKRFEVPLVNPGLFTKLEVQTVLVDLTVSPIPAERSFDKVNVKVLAPYGFAGTVEPSRVKATVSGAKELLDGLRPDTLELQADGRALGEGKHEVELKADPGSGITLLSTEPKKVKVHLVKE